MKPCVGRIYGIGTAQRLVLYDLHNTSMGMVFGAWHISKDSLGESILSYSYC